MITLRPPERTDEQLRSLAASRTKFATPAIAEQKARMNGRLTGFVSQRDGQAAGSAR